MIVPTYYISSVLMKGKNLGDFDDRNREVLPFFKMDVP